MHLHPIDLAIVGVYLVGIVSLGWALSRRASQGLEAYFLAGKSLPWWIIGTSHGASGFDITGTMWFVAMLYTYGLKAAWIPWIWPLFDRVFRQVYLGAWIRRSNVLTGAEWMKTRFGTGVGGSLSHLSVVTYALIACVGFLGYAFQGIGKFATVFFPWDLAWGPFSNTDTYAIIILLLTASYLILGGWYSVVITDLVQFLLLTIASVFIAYVAMSRVAPDALAAAVPEGWSQLWLGWRLDLDWSGLIPELNRKIEEDGFTLLGAVIMMMLFKGLLVSTAGPTPGYGIQHVLSTRSPREAALENWWMSVVQLIPRFLMITGIAVLALVYFTPEVKETLAREGSFDFEQILPYVLNSEFIPVGLVGLLMAGLLAAFMSTFDSTVNAGAAYVVNDVYKRYLKPNADSRRYVRMSYWVSMALVVMAIVVGMQIDSIHSVTKWITALLYGGYVAPNILKWHWWRFNGYGYFAGMISGVVVAMILPWVLPGLDTLVVFPIVLGISTLGSVWVSLATPPESEEVLESFYRTVRPWGFWRPVYARIRAREPEFEANRNLRWDAFNVAVGIVWQLMLMVVPICLVIREYRMLWISLMILVVTSVVMKFTWYDRLGPGEMYLEMD